MGQSGFLPHSLFLLRKLWDDNDILVEDSYGQEWVRDDACVKGGEVNDVIILWNENNT